MKKRMISVLLCVAVVASMIIGCGTSKESSEETATTEDESNSSELETTHIRLGSGTGVHIFNSVAEEQGYLEEEGLTVEIVMCETIEGAFTALSTGKVDVLSTYGTSLPLQYIGSGSDLTIYGGYMITGCSPIIAAEGTKWNGVEDLIGKKVASTPAEYAISGALLDLGYDPMNDVQWMTNIENQQDRIEAVRNGEVDYATLGTSMHYNAEQAEGIDIVAYLSDVTPNYSCCRVESTTEFVNENPNTIKALLRAWLRGQAYYEENKEDAIKTTAEISQLPEESVASYVYNDHYNANLDPFKSSIERAWRYMGDMGFLAEEAADINIDDHINTSLYKEVLDECVEKYYDENPEFYDRQLKIFEENDL